MENSIKCKALYDLYKRPEIIGRYITNKDLEPFINYLSDTIKRSIAGYSVLQKPIHLLEIGTGQIKLLIWSQMHGNESTTTKALLDFVKFLTSEESLAREICAAFTFKIIPILNPDGAEVYTRTNANDIDLNRDFLELTQPESEILMNLFESFGPDFCFNMHDQRTIFSVGDSGKPATISFLAPSFNDLCDLNDTRSRAIGVIVDIIEVLQEAIPGQIGRFDDAYNRNCVGDTFQSLGISTILFEAGHYQEDYDREKSREVVFISLLIACESIANKSYLDNRTEDYLKIPQNKALFYDFVYKNVKFNYDKKEIISTFAAQYKEVLKDDSISLIAYISDVTVLENIKGHVEYDGEFELFSDNNAEFPTIGHLANFKIGAKDYINGSFLENSGSK